MLSKINISVSFKQIDTQSTRGQFVSIVRFYEIPGILGISGFPLLLHKISDTEVKKIECQDAFHFFLFHSNLIAVHLFGLIV